MNWKHNLSQLLGNATQPVQDAGAPSGATLRSTTPQPAPPASAAPTASRWRTSFAAADVEDAVVIAPPRKVTPA